MPPKPRKFLLKKTFQELKELELVVDLTKQDHLLTRTGRDDDELSRASQAPQQAAGLLKCLNSDHSRPVNSAPADGVNSGFGPGLHASTMPIPHAGANSLIHNSLHPPRPLQQQPPENSYQAPSQMPPWLVDIHQGLQSLHSKADQQYHEISTCLQTHGTRILHLESISAEHTTHQQKQDDKLKQLESKVQELQAAVHDGSRSPRRTYSAPRSPRSPRSPRFFGNEAREEDDEPNLDIIIGGWIDARRDDAIEEAKNILQDAQVPMSEIGEIWSPYSRTNFVKLRLLFDSKDPRGGLTLSAKRGKQNRISREAEAEKIRERSQWQRKSENLGYALKNPRGAYSHKSDCLDKGVFSPTYPISAPDKPKPFPPNTIDIHLDWKAVCG